MKILFYVLLAIVIAGGVYWFTASQVAAPAVPSEQQVQPADAATQAMQANQKEVADAIARGDSIECLVEVDQPMVQSRSTVRTAGGNVRADFSAVANGQEIKGASIVTGGFVYTWSDLAASGYKVPVSPQTDPLAPLRTASVPTDGVTFECHPWVGDQSVFALPSDIQFVEQPAAQ